MLCITVPKALCCSKQISTCRLAFSLAKTTVRFRCEIENQGGGMSGRYKPDRFTLLFKDFWNRGISPLKFVFFFRKTEILTGLFFSPFAFVFVSRSCEELQNQQEDFFFFFFPNLRGFLTV